jgi:hypothetical protein
MRNARRKSTRRGCALELTPVANTIPARVTRTGLLTGLDATLVLHFNEFEHHRPPSRIELLG